MALIINGKLFNTLTEESFQEMIEEVKKLPEPEVIPFGKVNIKAEDVLLGLQRELVYSNKFNPTHTHKFIGSKMVYDCLVVYIYTETDYFLIHVDKCTDPIEITEYISQFNKEENIRVKLAGGFDEEIDSEKNLEKIIRQLFVAAQKLNVDIIIEEQKVLASNESNDEEDLYLTQCASFLPRLNQILKTQQKRKPRCELKLSCQF
jgi:hypothetical protein